MRDRGGGIGTLRKLTWASDGVCAIARQKETALCVVMMLSLGS